MNDQKLIFEQYIQAPIPQIFTAFTNATALREWLCDIATVEPKPDGRIYLAWGSGFYTCGEYLTLIPDERISFSWRGKDDPGRSKVEISIEAQNGGARVRLEHSVPSQEEDWQNTIESIEKGWRDSLENLASTLETGLDLRFARRPMLGVQMSDINAETARTLGVPVDQGLRLDVVIEGMGAQTAGLKSGDVLVSLDGFALANFNDLRISLAGKRAGEKVAVVFNRGSEKMNTIMELSQRPLLEIPTAPVDLVRVEKEIFAGEETALRAIFDEITEAEASKKPAPEEWSVKEILAHLIEEERFWHFKIVDIVSHQEHWTDEGNGNPNFQVQATVEAFSTLEKLMEGYRLARIETIALFSHLPEDFVHQKASYWRIAYETIETPSHFDAHLEQMRATIAAVKAAS